MTNTLRFELIKNICSIKGTVSQYKAKNRTPSGLCTRFVNFPHMWAVYSQFSSAVMASDRNNPERSSVER